MTTETNEIDHGRPVVIAQASSLPQADVICASLRTVDIEGFILNEHTSQLLPHLDLLINPKGIQVAVRQADEQAARQQLEKHEHIPAEVEDEDLVVERNLTDRFARAAAASGIFAVFFNLLIVVTVWYYFRAKKSAHKLPPTDQGLFNRNMKMAILYMVIAAIILTCLIAMTL